MNNLIQLGRLGALPGTQDRAVYTVKEVAQLLSLNVGGTYELLRSGVIPAERLGHRWVIPRRRFHAWLDGVELAAALPDEGA
jgi:excisionase family DNA binding protein